jgi:hypothetical protein
MAPTDFPMKTWTAEELRKLSKDQREAILAAAAALAVSDYRSDPELTAFEAFSKDDLQALNGDG